MTGTEFLIEGRRLYPDSKRVLLTAYADTDAAISAINDVQLDYYLVKPWDPPEHRLYPVLDDLLDDWLAGYTSPFDGIRVVGHRWSAESHATRDFLARNQVPYQWLDLALDPKAQELLELIQADRQRCPILIFPDGTVLERPSVQAIAEKVGLRGHAEVPLYDVVIIGAGPAGLASAVYAASEGLKTVVVECEAAGGQAGMSSRIENYLGFPAGLSGGDLARRAMTQARRFGTEFLLTEVASLEDHNGVMGVTLTDASELRAHSLVIATGVAVRTLLGKLEGFDARSETPDAAKRRIQMELDPLVEAAVEGKVAEDLAHGDAVVSRGIRNINAFDWLVRFQVIGLSRADIARAVAAEQGKDDPNLYRSNVGRAVRRAANLIELPLRDQG
jgi:thioredoxin reductase (NADPH)